MSNRIYEKDGVTILELKGTITLGSGDVGMRDHIKDLLGQGKKRIIIDLGDVSFMDSTGLGELVAAFTSARHQQASLKLAQLTKKIKDLLSITQLTAVFESYETLDEAIASFK